MRSDPLFEPPIIMNYDGIAGFQLLEVTKKNKTDTEPEERCKVCHQRIDIRP